MATLAEAVKALKESNRDRAYSICRKLNKSQNTTTFDSLQIEAVVLFEKGKYEKSLEKFKKCLEFPSDDLKKGTVLFNIARILMRFGQDVDAAKNIEEAIAIVPKSKNMEWRMVLAVLYGKLNQPYRVIELCKPLQSYTKYYIRATLSLVETAFQLSDLDMAISYLKQLEGHLHLLDARVALNLLTRMATVKPKDVLPLVVRLKARGKDFQYVSIVEAQCMYDEEQYEKAVELLPEEFIENLPEWVKRDVAYHTLAQAHDKLGQYEKAFYFFSKMNDAAAKHIHPDLWKHDYYPRLAKLDSFQPRKVQEEYPYQMAFLVGFPRSGTTLLENVLNSQEGIFTCDEKPVLQAVYKQIEQDKKRYPEDLHKLSDEYIDKLRNLYLSELRTYMGEKTSYKLVVDKMPPAMQHIPLICTLFPNAKVVLAIRHPLDNVLSCFMQNFRQNPQMIHFTNWKNCFIRYRDLFNLYENYKTFIDWQEHMVRYEDFVGDFEGEAEKLFDFLDYKANKEYKNFHKKAQNRIINTPSRSQVKKGIYQTSKYRWKKYIANVKPHQGLITPFINKFKYSEKS